MPVIAVVGNDGAIVDLLLDWSSSGDADVEMLEQDCGAFLDRYHGIPLGDLDLPGMVHGRVVRGVVVPTSALPHGHDVGQGGSRLPPRHRRR